MSFKLTLERPSLRYIESYVGNIAEQEQLGLTEFWDDSPARIRAHPEAHLDNLLGRERPCSPHSNGDVRIPERILWGVVDGQYVGRISIRTALNRRLAHVGGHVGFDVRPSARNRGIATEMLRQVIPLARTLGLTRLLLTCDSTNIASQKAIARADAFQDFDSPFGQGNGKLRFWIPTIPLDPSLSLAVDESLCFLNSPSARKSAERDPYWPKWDSPLWHMQCLREIGRAHLVPRKVLDDYLDVVKRHYLPHFPFRECELPEGLSAYHHVKCHCFVGSLLRLIQDCECGSSDFLHDIFAWIAKYQLPDGGLNCDESAYIKDRKVSSFVSSAPIFEGMLQAELSSDEVNPAVTDRLAHFFAEHRIHRSLRTGLSVEKSWMTPIFPRFYEYDVLRGTAALCEWLHRRNRREEFPWLGELVHDISSSLEEGCQKETRNHLDEFSLVPGTEKGWEKGRASIFPLLRALSEPSTALPFLRAQLQRIQWQLDINSPTT